MSDTTERSVMKNIELAPCPFCGSEPEMKYTGNEWTKSRKIEIKCPGCRVKLINASMKHGFDWLEDVTVKAWNTRHGQ